ncbi:glycerate kinase family-domain-containing protein [Parachaetomium inaequale]|uniref:Glycerate kinase family-domain-containing protein n=1 Tax=Parachaetomium inaequale TaxID=2588326 RepID=A0AAN6P9J3_9PEZI|nr:glycerate kinase family-domain-containing protein [Parachaetomium inaequale]
MTSHAVGTLMRAALDAGCTKMHIICGKTDACDAGAGMLEALGFQFLDRHGQRLHGSTPDRMSWLASISVTDDLHPRLRNGWRPGLSVACDGDNHLDGRSVVSSYNRQANTSADEVERIAHATATFAAVASRAMGADIAKVGGGTSGGLVAGLRFLNPGTVEMHHADVFDPLFHLDPTDHDWDVVFIAERGLDVQSARGTVQGEIARWMRQRGARVVGLAQAVEEESCLDSGQFLDAWELVPDPLPRAQAASAYWRDAGPLVGARLEKAAARAARLLRAGMGVRRRRSESWLVSADNESKRY